MRKAVSGLVAVLAILSTFPSWSIGSAVAIPPPPAFLSIFPNGQSPGCYLYPNGHKEPIGGGFVIENHDTVKRKVTQTAGFWSVNLNRNQSKGFTLHAAGTYLQSCAGGPAAAPMSVPVTAPVHAASRSFRVTWADGGAPSTWTYGVQYRIGSGRIVFWKANTTARSAIFPGAGGKTYYFRARVRNPTTGKKTAWSPLKKVTT